MGMKLRILPIRFPRNGTPPHSPIWKGFMTKDFNQQRRGDVRRSSRNQSSGRYGEERTPNPARPRLNRASVDRAWESGARREHADYRTRSRDGQPQRDNRRNQYGSSPSAQNGRRPYGSRQNNFKRFERTPDDNDDPRPRSFDSHPRQFDDRRSSERSTYSDRPGPGTRSGSGYRDNRSYRDQRPSYRVGDRDRSRGDERRDFDRDNRPPRNSPSGNRQARDFQQPNTQHPRWRSRPLERNNDQPRGRQEFNRHERFGGDVERNNRLPHGRQDFNKRERFEGDYERFETPEAPRPRRPMNRSSQEDVTQESEERHVTHLPDGRVLKGPRAVQRKNAQFWTEVADDVEALVEPIDASVPEKNASTEGSEPTEVRKPRTRANADADRGKKAKAKPSKVNTGTKPSKRGYKWPSP